MYQNVKCADYTESLDYAQLPGFDRLTEKQQQHVHEVYSMAYHATKSMGMRTAMGRAHESAKMAVQEALRPQSAISQDVPPSIFDGLENCR
jgi:hypothetical protein